MVTFLFEYKFLINNKSWSY
ncbi:hypothetical protein RDI58_021790 [Solanum bulbocastanum]|uniref:Uncharacterized protein n=1 Tax=Solanum bulbocastanum TaxID=147425 RepID=A0AAN8Y5H7_SOLBU